MSDILTAALPIRNDPWYKICLAAEYEKGKRRIHAENIRDEILAGQRAEAEGRYLMNMDGGPYFHDTRGQSILTAPATAITLATTDKLLHPGSLTAVPAGYFTAGKMVRITVFGTFTTVLTPTNLGIELYVGSADAGGTLLASSAAAALIASQTAQSMYIRANFKCNGGAVETAKPVEAWAEWGCAVALVTAANQQAANPIPTNAPAAVNIDNTLATLGANIQIKRSGSTAETFTTRSLIFESLT